MKKIHRAMFFIIGAILIVGFIVYILPGNGTNKVGYENAKKSVVTIVSGIDVEKEILTSDVLVGTGFCYKTGMVMTNYHNIKGSESVINVITYDDSIYPAELIAKDESADIALLKIDSDIPAVNFGTVKRIGQTVKSITTPISVHLRECYSEGVITNRDIVGFGTQRLIQTDINLSPGCSGGPLFDEFFNVVGMITFKSTEFGAEGLGFAIPTDRLQKIIKRLEDGIVTIDLGLTFQSDIYQKYGIPGAKGLIIQAIAEESVVQEQLQVGDMVISVNEQDVSNMVEYIEALESYVQGEKLLIKIVRNGGEQVITVEGG